jgi:protein required for attachment to host cells
MKRNWWVIANAARARVLEETDKPGCFRHVADLVHPPSRMKGERLRSDRPGHVEGTGHGLGSASFLPRTDPRVREHERFSRAVAQTVNDGVAQGHCAGLTLVASDPFLGQIKSHLSAQATKLLLRTVSSDYTSVPDADLARRVRAACAGPEPAP